MDAIQNDMQKLIEKADKRFVKAKAQVIAKNMEEDLNFYKS